MKGTVKFFNKSKGYGFITNEETRQDIFVHITGLACDSLDTGDIVEFEETEGRKGTMATNVRKASVNEEE